MSPSLHSWLLSKWLAVFVVTVLVTPGLLEENPGAGPANEEEINCKKKRLIALCKKCSFKAQTEEELKTHKCEPMTSTAGSGADEGKEQQELRQDSEKPSTSRHKRIKCNDCGSSVWDHYMPKHKTRCKVRCRICNKKVSPLEYAEHKRLHEFNLRNSYSQPSIPSDSLEQEQQESRQESDEVEELTSQFSRFIKTSKREGRVMDSYNFELKAASSTELIKDFKSLFAVQRNSFKVKISLGVILFNRRTEEHAYYKSSQNNQQLFERPTLIRNSSDKAAFIKKLEETDIIDAIKRPSSEWTVVKVTNATFYTFKLAGIPIGAPLELPPHLTNNNGLYSITKNKKGQHYKDNLCFFRCLSLHQGAPVNGLEKKTNELYKVYCEKASIKFKSKDFPGVTVDRLEEISRIFDVAINVFEQDEMGNTNSVFRTIKESDKPLNLNLYGNHFSFIKNLDLYSKSYRCNSCNKLWSHLGHLRRHAKNCEGGVKHSYGRGNFQLKPTVFQLLEEEGINVPKKLRPFPFRATYDIECMLKPDPDIEDTTRISYCSKHVLASISICSNVPGFKKPKCFVLSEEGKQKSLVKEALDYLMQISETSSSILRERYSEYIDQIESETTLQKFEDHLCQLPVISFNGASYDLRILKEYLIPAIVDQDSLKFVIKKGTRYMAIVTEELRFLDITYYIAPSFSYAQFLEAYGAKATKGYFPYEWFTELSKLKSDTFPSLQDFFSSLSERNTLKPTANEKLSQEENEHIGRQPNSKEQLTEDEMGEITQFRYDSLSDNFYEKEWTMKDFLIHYNNIDVQPFLVALENLSLYYVQRGVDPFKDGMSVPGIAERIAFGTLKSDEYFMLFNKKNADLVDLFRRNNVGGPAIIFDRHQEAGITKIRHSVDGKDCQKIVGYDANALYLWCMQQKMPCGMFIRRTRDEIFERTYPKALSGVCCEWMSYLETSRNIEIQHARNNSEFRVGNRKIPVDGYCRKSGTIFQFHGCFFHGCKVCFNGEKHDRDLAKNGWKSFNERFKATEETTNYIREAGYKVEEMWECSWRELKKTVQFENKYLYPGEEKVYMRESEILKMVRDDTLFGAIEVDIRVPDELREYFSEMTPIFKNTTINRSDIGTYMLNYLENSKQKFSERRSLIGSMFGEKILLITPLLKWYMEHGLVVTCVYQVIQFNPKDCFRAFGDQVSDDRRAGDADPTKKIIADTSKLIGNSVYGHAIMDKSKHTTVKFCDLEKASQSINDPFFTSFEEFDEDTYEVTLTKRSIKHDLPIQLGYFVYQYAKLRMLSFYYDIIDRFVDRSNFCLLEMDTDSLYIALSGKNLESVIKPELYEDWENAKKDWFPRTDTKENAAFDLRTPGLFKLEWEGNGFVGLAAKTYYCFKNDGKDKHSAKGVSRKFQLTKEDYLNVLNLESSVQPQINKGFVVKGKSTYTYELVKQGLNHFYAKRKVLANGMSTTFLDI